MDRLSGFDVFVRIIDEGSLSAAARSLNVSPSAVSRQVSALEDRLGARLLNRSTRRLSLTDTGRAFLDRARTALAAVEEAESAVLRLSEAPRGTLRLNYPVSFGQVHVAPQLPAFLARYPDLELEVTQNDRFVNLVEEGIDVAIRVGALADSALIARRLAPIRRVVCAAPAYLERHGRPQTPEDLTRHVCLTFIESSHRMEWIFGEGETRRRVTVSGPLRTNSAATLVEAAISGIGIIRMSNYTVVDPLRDGRLVPLLEAFETQETSVYAVYPANRHLSPKVRAFIDHMVESIGNPAYWQAAGLADR